MSIFERRHYQAIAEVIAEECEGIKEDGTSIAAEYSFELHDVTYKLCDKFLLDNPNFNREGFLKACGMEGEAS